MAKIQLWDESVTAHWDSTKLVGRVREGEYVQARLLANNQRAKKARIVEKKNRGKKKATVQGVVEWLLFGR